MTCDETRELCSAYLDEALAPDERRLVDAHLAGCAECRRELEALARHVALLQRVEPARAPRGLRGPRGGRGAAPPWYRRAADAVLLPLAVKLPLEAAAVVMVALLAVYLFERTPELQQAAREVAPAPEPPAPAKEKPVGAARGQGRPVGRRPRPRRLRRGAGASGRRARPGRCIRARRRSTRRHAAPRRRRLARATGGAEPGRPGAAAASAPPASAAAPPEAKPGQDGGRAERERGRRAAPARPRAASGCPAASAGLGGAPAPRLARGWPPSAPAPARTSVARVAVKDRDAAERELAALIARLGGSVTQRRREDETTVVEA